MKFSQAPMGSTRFMLYQSGLRFGCWGLAIYALSCAIYSMTIEKLIHIFGYKILRKNKYFKNYNKKCILLDQK